MIHKKTKLLIGLLLCCSFVHAQRFAIKANFEPVNANGFYAINITPQVSSYLSVHFNDLRISDEKDKFIPYVIHFKHPSFITSNYNKLPITKNELNDSGKSELIIKNQPGQKISSIALLMRNASVNRLAAISGSDDEKKWFTIDENINLKNVFSNDTDRYVQTINFPVSSYRFFKLTIDNKNNNPLNVIEAGSYSNVQHTEDVYVTNPPPAFVQTDSSDNNTYIKIHQDAAYHVDVINLEIESPKFFNQNVDVINASGVYSFTINSNKASGFTIPAFNDKNWYIKIYNGDNPPLKIKAIRLQQESKNIIAYLQAGVKYHLLMQDSTATAPSYDLQKFEDSIPSVLPQLKIISYENIIYNTSKNNKHTLSLAWIWILIFIAIVALGFITFRLMKEVGKEK